MPRDWIYNGDTLATELSISDEIDTSVTSPPVTIITPPSGKRISTRGAHIFSNSNTGEIEIRFQNSGLKIAKIYCDKRYHITLPNISFNGDPDDPLIIDWSGLSTGAKIFYMVTYKLV